MPKNAKNQRGFYSPNRSSGGGGGLFQRLFNKQEGASQTNSTFDPNFDPNKQDYSQTTFGYDPNIDYVNPVKDTRGFLGKMFGQPDYAGQINQAYQAQRAMGPLQLGQFKAEQGILTNEQKQREQDKLGLEHQAKLEDETRGQVEAGKAFYQNAMTGVDPNLQTTIDQLQPSPELYPSNNTFKMFGRNIPSAFGSNLGQGTIAGIPSAQASTSGSLLQNSLNQANQPFANDIAATTRKANQGLAIQHNMMQSGFTSASNLPKDLVDLSAAQEHNVIDNIPIPGAPPGMPGMQRVTTQRIPAGVQSVPVPEAIPSEFKQQVMPGQPQVGSIDSILNGTAPIGQGLGRQPTYPLLSQPNQSTFNLSDVIAGNSKLLSTPRMNKGKIEATIEESPESLKKKAADAAKKRKEAEAKLTEMLIPYKY